MNAVITDLPVPGAESQPTQVPAKEAPASARHASSETKPARKGRRTRSIVALTRSAVIVGGIGLATVIPLGWGQWVAGFTDQTTDNAYLRADTTPISAQVAGRIRTVAVSDFMSVRAGQVLAEIDPAEYRARVSRAGAAVSAAEAAIQNVDSQVELQHRLIAQADAEILAIAADQDRAAAEFGRQAALVKNGASATQRLEVATADTKRFQAQMVEKRAAAEAQRQQLDVLNTRRLQALAELDGRRAELDLANIELGYTRITAPVDGVVNASNVRAGQYVAVGTRIISVIPMPRVYVLANYKETQLGKVRPGQSATITVDTFPGRTLTGHVVRISPASGSEFALLPADNATGNFTKVAQRIAVRIELDNVPQELVALLRPGISVVSTIHTDSPQGTQK
jgi:membrane fusion protein (multidrug efflux system)